MKLAMIVRGDSSGIGIQSKRTADLIKPDRVLYIDSTSFAQNTEQHPEWYSQFKTYVVKGFPHNRDVQTFLRGVTHLVYIETPYNINFLHLAKRTRVKTYCICNYEFLDNLANTRVPEPDYFLMPSHWKFDEMRQRFGIKRVLYLPPPIDPEEFSSARTSNRKTHNPVRLLHTVGTLAVHDRNGTLDLLEALKMTTTNFRLTITSQHQLPPEYMVEDGRVSYQIYNARTNAELYEDYDALILPRRYGGLSLGMWEGLMSGLPVIMPNISPNTEVLPSMWLVPANKKTTFQARTQIDVYQIDVKKLAAKLEWLCTHDLTEMKEEAHDLAIREVSEQSLIERYKSLW